MNEFCRKKAALNCPRQHYVKKAAKCLGRQPDSSAWVLNEHVHIDEDGNLIEPVDSDYIWLGSLNNRSYANAAPATDAAHVPLCLPPAAALTNTLT